MHLILPTIVTPSNNTNNARTIPSFQLPQSSRAFSFLKYPQFPLLPSSVFSLSVPSTRVTMPSTTVSLLLLLYLTAVAAADAAASESTSAACKHSFYPKLCRALLAPAKLPSDPYDYGRYSVKQALKQAMRTMKIIDNYLARGGHRGSRIAAGRGALDDCGQLAALNADFLSSVQAELGQGGRVLDQAGVGRVKALMSAIVTNQQTCYDGMEDSRSFPELYGSFSNETRLYGVSLELVTSALDAGVGTALEPAEPVAGQ